MVRVVDFVPQEHVSPGFEILLANKELSPGSKGGIWNLWWNVQLTDDPRAWDMEIRALNKIQRDLNLSRDQRLIPYQIAEFCRISPLFPESIDIICEEIGVGKFSKSYAMGCEGRCLLEFLDLHNAKKKKEQINYIRQKYENALKRVHYNEIIDNPFDLKVRGFLGELTDTKRDLIANFLDQLESGRPLSSIIKVSEETCRDTMGDAFDTRVRPLQCFDCKGTAIGDDGFPICLCCHGSIVDAGLLCSEVYNGEQSINKECRRFQEEYVLAYALVLNSWLTKTEPEIVTSTIRCKYITENIAVEIPSIINSLLGERKDVKTWLVGCLLKTLIGNQRWHDRVELIDSFPRATSWLSAIGG